jgi:hypothetical protein
VKKLCMKKIPTLIDWHILGSALNKSAGSAGDMAAQKLRETAEMAARAAEMAKNLPDEHAWALDHVATAHDDVSEVHGFLSGMNGGSGIEVDIEPSGQMQTGFDGMDGSQMQGTMDEINPNMTTSLDGQDGSRMITDFDPDTKVAGKTSGENKPTNPDLWSRAKAAAKKKFDVYPSAYANAWAVKWYNRKGGGWSSAGD